MSKINLGGPMPDGTRAHDLLVDASEFVCAAAASLSRGPFTNLLGKLCLTRTSLVMLPYEGFVLEVVQKLAEHLQTAILGPYAEMAGKLAQLGLYVNPTEVLDNVLVWPLANLDQDAGAESRLLGGADLLIKARGETYEFTMKAAGHESAGFASAQTFRDNINRLRNRGRSPK